MKASDLISRVDHLFEMRAPFIRMCQAIAENFYPMRADFDAAHASINLYKEPADWLSDSYPTLCLRDLANSIDPMLRDGEWFQMMALGGKIDNAGRRWLENSTRLMRTYMGLRESGWHRAVKQGDWDYAAFGQTVIQVSLRQDLRGPLYQNWHLKDCAWFDDAAGNLGGIARRWRPTREQYYRQFRAQLENDQQFKTDLQRDPWAREELYHIEFPAHLCDGPETERFPFVSYWVNKNREKILESVGLPMMDYAVPRFLTLAESPYAYSPATVSALPDARTLQAMTFTLLEAAERFSNPPIVATRNAILGPIDLSPNGVTYVDKEYDERLGEALRPLISDKSGYPIGQHERSRVVDTLTSAFFLDKLRIPMKEQEMTAYEVAELMKEYRRQNLPLFAPIETEYNGQLCELTFDVLMRGRFFGPATDIPESLLDREIQFKYKSPLSAAEESTRAAKFGQIQQLMTQAIELDTTLAHVVDLPTALRSSVEGLDVPSDWIRDEKEYLARVEQQRAQEQAAMAMQMAQTASEIGAAA